MMTATHIATSAWNSATNCWERVDIERIDSRYDRPDLSLVELSAQDLGCEPGGTYKVELLDDAGQVLDSVEVLAR